MLSLNSPESDALPFFFFNDTATTEIYTLSLHDALPIYAEDRQEHRAHPEHAPQTGADLVAPAAGDGQPQRSEEHTSELQSQSNLVCRLLLEKKITYGHGSLLGTAPAIERS